jgi:hypothetical protein
MNKKLIISAMLVSLLALGLALAGCDNGTTGGDGNNNSGGDQYTIEWAMFNISYTDLKAIMQAAVGAQNVESGSNYAMAKGTAAETGFQILSSTYSILVLDSGTETGSFEKLVGFSKDGVSVPAGLKTLLNNNKNNVPLAALFAASGGTVAFYATKK